MDNSILILQYGSLLIESPLRENEEQFHAYLTGLLKEIYGQLPSRLKFEVGDCFERRGVFFKAFLCRAGSVDSNILQQAQRPGGLDRKIICRGTRQNAPYCCEIHLGIEDEFDCDELRKIKK